MEMLINVQTNKIGAIVNTRDNSVVLNVEGEMKEYTKSTIRRWWKAYTIPTSESTPVQPVTIQHHTTSRASYLLDLAQNSNCTIKVTKSYTGIKFGKSTIMEVHTTKKGKTTIVMNSKAISEYVLEEILENHRGKLVPESYGWTLNLKVDADTLTPDQVALLLNKAIEYVR